MSICRSPIEAMAGGDITMMLSPANAPEPPFLPSRFTGKERDTQSGNDYFAARYCAGRLIQFAASSLNR